MAILRAVLRQTPLHEGWSFIRTQQEGRKAGFSTVEWLPAQVPGHVHLDLVANGVIADPLTKMHELGAQWVDREDWSYRTTFEWTPDPTLPRRVLRFDGLDTVAKISLNGVAIGATDNMFVAHEFDVTDHLREGVNELRVDFLSAVETGERRREAYFAQEGMVVEGSERFDERAFVRKAQYQFGWDWGPRLVSCGIWQPVRLLEFAGRILDVRVTHEEGEDGWIVRVVSEFEGEGRPVHHFDGLPEDEDGFAPLLEGDGEIEVPYGSFGRWSPESPLTFTVETSLVHDGEAQDTWETISGFVTTRLLREPDEFGESFEFEVNGRKLWIRGANWIPDHAFPALVDGARLADRLGKAKDLGINMLRVWGGGLYESDEFYQLCDEYGILVWQDFPFACSYYPDDEPFRAVVRDEAIAAVKRLRNHPCLALWCGNNENHEMFYNRWCGDRTPPRYYGLPLYDDTLPAVVAEFDAGRSYIPSSPIGTPPDEEGIDHKRKGPNADLWGDQHNWDVWHGRGDWRYYTDSKGRFSSEYGFASSCSTALWRETLGDISTLTPRSPEVVWHDKTGKGTETFIGYTELHYPKQTDLEGWVYYSQLNQRDALRHGIEHYRRAPFCRGSLIWQLNDCWPVQSWAALGSNGEYKALAYELRRLHADLLLTLEKTGSVFTLSVCNDGPEEESIMPVVYAVDIRTGEILRTVEVEPTEVAPDWRGPVASLDIAGLPATEVMVVAGEDGAETFRLGEEPKNMKWPAPEPIVASLATDGFVTLRTTQPLVDLMLTENGSTAPFYDDFVTLPTPGIHMVRTLGRPTVIEARSLAGKHEVRMVRGEIG